MLLELGPKIHKKDPVLRGAFFPQHEHVGEKRDSFEIVQVVKFYVRD